MTDNALQEIEADDEVAENDIFADLGYICKSTSLIVDSLQRGLDVAQMPNGDVLTTEIKVVNTQYSWDKNRGRMAKIGQN